MAAIGNGSAFRRGRDFAAWVGAVPRQYSTGGKQKLCGISKRGNVYLRRKLIHGARAAARAYALQSKTSQGADADAVRVRALAAYKELWKDADPEIPILKQAKAEDAKLQ